MFKKCRLLLFIAISITNSMAFAVTPEQTQRYNQCKAINKGLVYLKQEALRLAKKRTAPITQDHCWHLTEIFHGNHLNQMHSALNDQKRDKLRTLIANLDLAFDVQEIGSRKVAVAQEYNKLNSWLDDELTVCNQEHRPFIQQYDAQRADELKNKGKPRSGRHKQPSKTQGQLTPTEATEEPEVELTNPDTKDDVIKPDENGTGQDQKADQPNQGLNEPLDDADINEEDPTSNKSLMGQVLGWISKHKALTGILGVLTAYSVLAELFGWFPFRTTPAVQV